MTFNIRKIKMEKDENTAYDEVVRDIAIIGDNFIKHKKEYSLFKKKINQLMRLLNDEEVYEK